MLSIKQSSVRISIRVQAFVVVLVKAAQTSLKQIWLGHLFENWFYRINDQDAV